MLSPLGELCFLSWLVLLCALYSKIYFVFAHCVHQFAFIAQSHGRQPFAISRPRWFLMHRLNPEKKLLILRYFSRLLFYLPNKSDLEKHFIEKLNAKSFFKNILKNSKNGRRFSVTLLSDSYTNALVNTVIGEHLQTQHDNKRAKIDHLFKVLKKSRRKFECLIYEMLT